MTYLAGEDGYREAYEAVGVGQEGVSFQHEDKPAFAAFVKSAIDIDISLDPDVRKCGSRSVRWRDKHRRKS
jgi:hypothetical protein